MYIYIYRYANTYINKAATQRRPKEGRRWVRQEELENVPKSKMETKEWDEGCAFGVKTYDKECPCGAKTNQCITTWRHQQLYTICIYLTWCLWSHSQRSASSATCRFLVPAGHFSIHCESPHPRSDFEHLTFMCTVVVYLLITRFLALKHTYIQIIQTFVAALKCVYTHLETIVLT